MAKPERNRHFLRSLPAFLPCGTTFHRVAKRPTASIQKAEPLAIVPEKILQFEALAIEESPLDSDVIAGLKRP
jgi:hypothetical protein